MKSFDSLSLKYFYNENCSFISGAVVQKIQLPSRHEVILNLRNISLSKNKKLYININPKYPHTCFIESVTIQKRNIIIPNNPPMFCMQLRKYLSGSKIKDFRVIEYERIMEIDFDYFDEIGSLIRLTLAIEFMGKYSNIILYNKNSRVIIGSIHNVSSEKSSIREVFGGAKYIYPPLKNKLDILKTSYSTFFEIAKEKDIKKISDNFYYFSNGILENVYKKINDTKKVFDFLQNLENLDNKEFIISYWDKKNTLTEAIDSYFSNIIFCETLKKEKEKLKKCLSGDIKKNQKILSNKPDNTKALDYKSRADLIMCNLYSIKPKQKELIAEGKTVELDANLSADKNAQKYYSLYKKSLSTYKHSFERYIEAKEKDEYYASILFNIDNSENFSELKEIESELFRMGLVRNFEDKNQEIKIGKIEFDSWEIYIGKNNKQNDYLISKIASGEDLWFHGLNFPSAHVILKIYNNKNNPPASVLEYCARLVKENSIAKNSTKTSIIMTKRKNLKKPPNSYPGYVTYKNEIEIVV